MGRDDDNHLGIGLTIKFDPDQFHTLNSKLDKILAGQDQAAKLASVTAGLKKSGEALTSAVTADQPQP